VGKLVPQCQTILDFAAAIDDGGDDSDNQNSMCRAPAKSPPSTYQPFVFFYTGCPSCRPTNSVKALKAQQQLKGSVKEPNKFHNYETGKITRKANDTAEYIELFGSLRVIFSVS